jgi:hypothetical protein
MSEWLLLEVKIALPHSCNFQSSWVNKEKPEKEKKKLFSMGVPMLLMYFYENYKCYLRDSWYDKRRG